MEKLLSAQQVADHLRMHIKTLYRLVRDNQIALKFVRKGRSIAFRPSDVEMYLSLNEVKRDGTRKKAKNKKPKSITIPQFFNDEQAKTFAREGRFYTDAEAREFFRSK